MLKKGDKVMFSIGFSTDIYTVISDEYELEKDRKVVDLEGYSGEVATEYLRKVG
jgi:hypothetical protein